MVGARCRRQGIGAHLARFCALAGARVVAVLGTTPATAAEAARLLCASTGQEARPHTGWDEMLADTLPQAVVIACPHESHATFLRHALDAGLHVLCEKPLVWGDADPVVEGEGLARAFLDARRHLHVNTQWPFTLPTYARLFPETRGSAPARFRMHLSPRSTGLAMLVDALPHALSMLAALLPDPQAILDEIDVQLGDSGRRASVCFTYAAAGGRVAAQVHLQRAEQQPRRAAYALDDRVARRVVQLPSYAMALESEAQRIPLPDPTPLLVRSFLDAVAAGPPREAHPGAVPGMRHLAQIVAAAQPRTA